MHLPPILALYLTLGFIVFLFRRDIREQRHVTGALWIPLLWLMLIGSRFVSEWLQIFGLHVGAVNVEDGSPLDACVFGLLIGSGLYVLNRRRVKLSEVVRNNRWLTAFLFYCLLSILWSDVTFVALKRWLKVLGHPVMVLVVLTEPDHEEAVIRLLKRCAYVWIPISIVFIKYFPDLGRSFSFWTGAPENNGITMGKNMLGIDLLVMGGFFFWFFLKVWQTERGKQRRNELILIALFGGMIGWLFDMAQSSTSLVSFLIMAAILVFLGRKWVNPQYLGIYLLGAVFAGIVAEGAFGIYTSFLQVLGKDPNLSDRVFVWHDLLQMQNNPVLGVGFESFWLGDRLKPLWAKWWWHPNEAHNNYLETYLNLGLVGLFLLIGWFIATYRKARRDLLDGLAWGRFRLAFLVAVLFYGWTESAFKATNPIWFIFFMVTMDYPKPESAVVEQSLDTGCLEDDNTIMEKAKLNCGAEVAGRSGVTHAMRMEVEPLVNN